MTWNLRTLALWLAVVAAGNAGCGRTAAKVYGVGAGLGLAGIVLWEAEPPSDNCSEDPGCPELHFLLLAGTITLAIAAVVAAVPGAKERAAADAAAARAERVAADEEAARVAARARRAHAGELAVRAGTAAKAGDCARVRFLAGEVERLDGDVYAAEVTADPAIAACLVARGP